MPPDSFDSAEVCSGMIFIIMNVGHSKNIWHKKSFSALTIVTMVCGLLPSIPAHAAQASADSLVGYWKFDETSGVTAADSSGDGKTGTHQGGPTVSADVPLSVNFPNTQSRSFDGVDDYMQMSYSPSFTSGNSFTWSLWFKTGLNQNGKGLFSARDTGKTGSPLAEIYLVSGKVQALFRGANGTRKDLEYTVSYADSAWHHIAVVINNGNGVLYFDGVQRSTITGLDMGIDLSGVYIPIGASNYEGTVQRFFTGNIDDVRIYNRALAPWEVTQLSSGNHVQAFWKGKSGTGFEKKQNWSGSYIPDPYSRVVIRATATGSLTLTGAIKAAGLTINTGALMHLNGTGFTMNDSGTFRNHGTLALRNTETLTNLTNDISNGTVMLIGSGSTSGLRTGNSYYNLTLNDGMVAYWKFDDASGTRIPDHSGYGNSGSIIGGGSISAVPAPVNFYNTNSLSLNGTNSYVNATDFPTGESITLSFWVNPSTTNSQAFIGKHAYDGDNIVLTGIYSGGYYVRIRSQTYSAGTVTTGWQHLAYTFRKNGSATQVTFHKNGVELWSQSIAATIGTTTGLPWVFGQDWDSGPVASDFFGGLVDEVRIYNRTLLSGEIAALAAGNQPSLTYAEVGLNADTDINGNLVLNGMRLSSSGRTLTVGGSWMNNGGIFSADDWIVRMDGNASTIRIQSGGQPFNDLHLEGNGTYTLSDRLTVNGALNLTDGTLDVDATENYPINVNVLSQTDGSLVSRDGTIHLIQPVDQVLQYTGALNDLIIEDPTEYGLIGYWKFDEGTNTGAILDASGYGNTGIRHGTGAVWTGATLSGLDALQFDNPFVMTFNGYNDVVEAPQSSTFEVQSFTIGAWMDLSPTAGDRNAIVTYGKGTELGGGVNDESVGFIYHQTANILRLRLENVAGVAFIDLQSTPRTSLSGNWSHVAATWDGSTATLYQDGVVIGTATTTGRISYSSDSLTKLRIGNWFGNNERWFNGSLDDVRIYDRPLSGAEVKNLANGIYADGDTSTSLVTLDGTLDLSTISIVSGIFDLTAGTPDVEVSGDWNNYAGSGGLLAGTSTVMLNGPGTQNVRGSTAFSALEITGTSARTVNFGSGTTQWISTDLTLQGASSNLLTLAPLSSGYRWYLDLGESATQTIDYVSTSYSNASGGLVLLANNGTSTDGGNNANWLFTTPTVSFLSGSLALSETAGTVSLTITRSGSSLIGITIPYSYGGTATGTGSDYTIRTPSPLYMAAGETSTGVILTLNDDSTAEVDETVVLTLGTPTNATLGSTGSMIITLTSDDVASSSSSSSATDTTTGGSSGGEGGGGYRGATGPGGSSSLEKVQQARMAIAERFNLQMQYSTVVAQEKRMPASVVQKQSETTAVTATDGGIGLQKIAQRRGVLIALVDAKEILYRDVVVTEWYAPYVASLIEDSVAQGYRDREGNLSGEFGVANPVTKAEVLKMALEGAKKKLESKPPRNRSAQNTWASAYVGQAEQMGLTVFPVDADVNMSATRGEVMQILLEVMGLPVGKAPAAFADVPSDHPFNKAISTAAFYGIAEGDTDASGTLLNTFRPDDKVNRAEVAKIIALLREILK